jgi:hypothetical protein
MCSNQPEENGILCINENGVILVLNIAADGFDPYDANDEFALEEADRAYDNTEGIKIIEPDRLRSFKEFMGE